MQDGRYAFRGKNPLLLPLLFLLPQLAITVVFFFYPAGEALMGSFYMEDSFGLSKEFVGLDNFITLFSDPSYLETLRYANLANPFEPGSVERACGYAEEILLRQIAEQAK